MVKKKKKKEASDGRDQVYSKNLSRGGRFDRRWKKGSRESRKLTPLARVGRLRKTSERPDLKPRKRTKRNGSLDSKDKKRENELQGVAV